MADIPKTIAPYDLIQKQLPKSLLILDSSATILSVNKEVVSLFGVESEQELLGKSVLQFVLEDDKEKVKNIFEQIITENNVSELLFRVTKKDGSPVQISGNASVILTNDEKMKQIVVIVRNAALQKSRIELLQEAQQQLSEAQQIAHFGSWIWDIPSQKFDWTDEMYHLFNLTPQAQEASNDLLYSLVHPTDKEKVKTFIETSLTQGSAVLDFRVGIGETNNEQWLHGRNKTFYDASHKPVRMVGTVHDITHEKALDKVKTQFLSLASHQLRGPLTTINWHAEMLLQQKNDGLSDAQKKYINELYNSSKQTVRLTNALLNVSALELGTMPFKPENLSLEKVAKRVIEDYQSQIAVKQLIFSDEYVPNLPTIQTDLYLLKTIFHALIFNAVAYTPNAGQVALKVGLDETTPETFVISVKDSGLGIPKDQQEKVFTKLFRATNAKANVMNGTGLDLYIVKLILQLNGGEIAFTSEENKGSTFMVKLPFVGKPVKEDSHT